MIITIRKFLKNIHFHLSTLNFQLSTHKGFTLIELLVVIAVLGILSAGVFTAINITGNLTKANLAKAKTFSASVENALAISQVGKWSFDDSAAPGKDTSGYGNNGTLADDFVGGSGPTWQTVDQCGLGFGGCLSFDGVGDSVKPITPPGFPSSLIPNNKLTLAAWIKPNNLTGNHYIMVKNGPFYLQLAGNKLYGQIFAGSPTASGTSLTGDISLTANAWHHVAMVYDGVNIKLYVDGKFDKQTAKNGNMPSTSGCFLIGKYSNGSNCEYGVNLGENASFFSGLIDEVQIYKEALFASQIQQLYGQGFLRHRLALR